MSLTSTVSTQQFTVTAVPQPALSVTFKAINATDLVVVDTNGTTKVDTLLINGSDYTVTQLNNNAGCVVTLEATGAHYAIGDTVTVSRKNPETQPSVFSGTTDMTGLEASLDWIVMQVQALQDKTDRCLRIPGSNVSTLAGEMSYNNRLLAFPYFDASGNLTTMTLATLTTTILGGSTAVVKNTIYAGPASGANASPTFRTLVVNDFAGGTGASATTFWCGDGTWKSASSGALAATGTPTNGQFAQWTNATTLQGVTLIPVASGGTNKASYTTGDILYASAGTTLAGLADVAAGSILVSGGVGVAPSYSATPIITTNLTVGSSLTAGSAMTINANAVASAGSAAKLSLSGGLNATINGDSLYGVNIFPTIGTGTFTGLTGYGVAVSGAATGSGTITNYYSFYATLAPTATNSYAFFSTSLAGIVSIGNTANSTTTSTGSIVTAGGLGVAKAVTIGTTLTVTGHVTLESVTSTGATGTGNLVFSSGPTFTAPVLGTPASGTVTNLTGTASININGTVGATTPGTGAFTTLSASGGINSTAIGASVSSTGAFTTLLATTSLIVDLGTAAGSLPAAINAGVVMQLGNANAQPNVIQSDIFSNSLSAPFQILSRQSGNTRASPAATPSGALIFSIGALGFGTALTTAAAANYQIKANSLWSGTNQETVHLWSGTPSASVTKATWLTLSGTGLVQAVGDLTLSAGNLIFSTTGKGWVGTATNDNTSAGNVGEYATATITTGSSVSLTTTVTATVTSISLTAGDWDVWGVVDYNYGATTSVTDCTQGISTTAATLGSQDTFTSDAYAAMVPGNTKDDAYLTPHVRLSLGSTTTVYLVAQATFTISTLKAYGSIFARRRR